MGGNRGGQDRRDAAVSLFVEVTTLFPGKGLRVAAGDAEGGQINPAPAEGGAPITDLPSETEWTVPPFPEYIKRGSRIVTGRSRAYLKKIENGLQNGPFGP